MTKRWGASNNYLPISIEQLDRNIALSKLQLPFFRNQSYLDEYLEMTASGTPGETATDEMYRRHPDLACTVHEHQAVPVTTGRQTFVAGEVDDNQVDHLICSICGIEL